MQDKAAFIFCVEDRALFCKECDEAIHSASSLAKNHQRFLATGIRVALSSSCNKDAVKTQLEPQPPQQNSQQVGLKMSPQQLSSITSPSWHVDDLLGFPDFESSDKVKQTYSCFFHVASYPIFSLCIELELETLKYVRQHPYISRYIEDILSHNYMHI